MTYPIGTAAAVVEVALKEVGTVEEGDNLTKYGKFTKAEAMIASTQSFMSIS